MNTATIVVVDDEAANVKVLAEALRHQYRVLVATNGAQALELVKNAKPDLVLLDIVMPVMDGYEVCSLLKLDPETARTPVIFVTAMTEVAEELKGLRLGAVDYITKPISPPIVLARVANHLELIRSRNRLAAEKQVVENVILRMQRSRRFQAKGLSILTLPLERISGDILLSAFHPEGSRHLMVGDFTGHGLPAALGGPMVSDVFYRMTEKGFTLPDILAEINRKVHASLPTGTFFAACALMQDGGAGKVWNCGLPDVLHFRENGLKKQIESNHLPLGILDGIDYHESGQAVSLNGEDRLFFFTDGVEETVDGKGRLFSRERLLEIVSEMVAIGGEVTTVRAAIDAFRGNVPQNDDITILEFRP